jgi:hypothetical protein
MAHQHDKQHDPDEFDADLERDNKGLPTNKAVPEEEQYIANPEPHHQHSRKGEAESPAELTLNQPEHKKHGR